MCIGQQGLGKLQLLHKTRDRYTAVHAADQRKMHDSDCNTAYFQVDNSPLGRHHGVQSSNTTDIIKVAVGHAILAVLLQQV